MDRRMEVLWMDIQTDGHTDGRMDGQTDGRMDRQTDGRTDEKYPHSTRLCPLSGPLPCLTP